MPGMYRTGAIALASITHTIYRLEISRCGPITRYNTTCGSVFSTREAAKTDRKVCFVKGARMVTCIVCMLEGAYG